MEEPSDVNKDFDFAASKAQFEELHKEVADLNLEGLFVDLCAQQVPAALIWPRVLWVCCVGGGGDSAFEFRGVCMFTGSCV